jgi:hypothetical protein
MNIPETNRASAGSSERKTRLGLAIGGLVLLAFWVAVWAISVKKNHLAMGKFTYIPPFPILGCDFDINYYAIRTWIAGGDPYQGYLRKGIGPSDYFACKYDHPPMVLPLFSWCILAPHQIALILWLAIQTAVFSLAVFTCWRNRKEMGLFSIPRPLLLAVTLFSYPVLCEMERGNWNVLVLFFLLGTVWALQGRSLARDFLAGGCAGIAAWIKVYPALFVFGLLALRRWRAAVFFGLTVLLIGLADVQGAQNFSANIKESAQLTPDFLGHFSPWSHTISGSWLLFCRDVQLKWLERLPGTAGWGLLVFPLILWVSYWVAKAPEPTRLLYPYFLWLAASATYLPPIANDYNLFFLLLAALAVWDCRDKIIIHVLMIFLLIWWQPIWLIGSGKFLYYSKLASLGITALILTIRAREQITQYGESREVAVAWTNG